MSARSDFIGSLSDAICHPVGGDILGGAYVVGLDNEHCEPA